MFPLMLSDSLAVINAYLDTYQSSKCTFGVAESEYSRKEVWEVLVKQKSGGVFTSTVSHAYNHN